MAYTNYGELDLVNGKRHKECTAEQLAANNQFYGEDLLIVLGGDPEVHTIRKFRASFWGAERAVWIAVRADDTVIQGLVALACPPYYPGIAGFNIGQGTFLEEADMPANFTPAAE